MKFNNLQLCDYINIISPISSNLRFTIQSFVEFLKMQKTCFCWQNYDTNWSQSPETISRIRIKALYKHSGVRAIWRKRIYNISCCVLQNHRPPEGVSINNICNNSDCLLGRDFKDMRREDLWCIADYVCDTRNFSGRVLTKEAGIRPPTKKPSSYCVPIVH